MNIFMSENSTKMIGPKLIKTQFQSVSELRCYLHLLLHIVHPVKSVCFLLT